MPVWSPDGRTIVFDSGVPFNLFRKDATGAGREERVTRDTFRSDGQPSGQPCPYLRTPFNERFGQFSPEPNPCWVAYDSDESGRADSKLMSVKLKVDADAVVPSAPVAWFEVDGSQISAPYAVAQDGRRFLVRVPVESSAE